MKLLENLTPVVAAFIVAAVVHALPGGDPNITFPDSVLFALVVMLHLRQGREKER